MRKKIHNFSNEISKRETAANEICYRAAIEGIVLLENDGTLPLKNIKKIALYGSGSINTLSGGTGSGDVNNRKNISIYEGLQNAGFEITSTKWINSYKRLIESETKVFEDKLKKSFLLNMNLIFGHLPIPSLIVTENDLSEASAAIYVIARQAGEAGDRKLEKGDYYLSDIEKESIKLLASAYEKFIVVINSGSVIDMNWYNEIPDIGSVIFFCQQGSQGGNALADIIKGNANPSGKLTDCWPVNYEDIPFSKLFGDKKNTDYKEGVYVGYRFFDAFNIKPFYHFGHGLSYTTFDQVFSSPDENGNVKVIVTNTGLYPGKDVVFYYEDADKSIYKKPLKVLKAFAKTNVIFPGHKEEIILRPIEVLLKEASISSSKEQGKEASISSSNEQGNKEILGQAETKAKEVLDQLTTNEKFKLVIGAGQFASNRIVKTDGAVGHTTSALYKHGVENMELSDGPAGLRLDRIYGVYPNGKTKTVTGQFEMFTHLPLPIKKFMLANPKKCKLAYQYASRFPVATALAQSFNLDLIEKVGSAISKEMSEFEITYFLAPALNIHKNPLCGRNFEYYSEDPLVSGLCAAALVKGVQSIPGHFATIKHYCCNNQETNRMNSSSNVDDVTLREIYLKGFEIAIKLSNAGSVMTSYNLVNNVHTCESEYLINGILRDEWGFNGVVMTDWYASINSNAARIIAAGGDLIMPGTPLDKIAIILGYLKGKFSKKGLTSDALNTACLRILTQYFESSL